MKMSYFAAIDSQNDLGIFKKINTQIDAFNKKGVETKLVRLSSDIRYSPSGKVVDIIRNWNEINTDSEFDAIYIRYPKSNLSFLLFLYKINRTHKNCKIIIEIPTYPYDAENSDEFLFMIKDKICRQLLRFFVDRIVTFSLDKKIWGIETIRVKNGVNFSETSIRKIIKREKEIHLIAVASMKNWHGYERLISGLVEYYKTDQLYKVVLHMVGMGPELNIYRKIAMNCNEKNAIIFHGNKVGEELDEIYDLCDIGILCLGTHRKNLRISSELKSREYVAKGLPMIGSCKLDTKYINNGKEFLRLPSNDDTIDIKDIVKFYNDVYGCDEENKESVSASIRNKGERVLDISKTIDPIVKYIKNNQ